MQDGKVIRNDEKYTVIVSLLCEVISLVTINISRNYEIASPLCQANVNKSLKVMWQSDSQ
jgi:hypothetical protein